MVVVLDIGLIKFGSGDDPVVQDNHHGIRVEMGVFLTGTINERRDGHARMPGLLFVIDGNHCSFLRTDTDAVRMPDPKTGSRNPVSVNRPTATP